MTQQGFEVGDIVRWESQSQASTTEKIGEVVDVLPVGARPPKELYPSFWRGAGPGIGRNHKSYIVKVGSRYYWPRVPQLRLERDRSAGEQKAQRFRFVQDDSCHWYAIPADKDKEFDRWLACYQEEYDDWKGTDFSEFRLNTHPSNYTFLALQEDK